MGRRRLELSNGRVAAKGRVAGESGGVTKRSVAGCSLLELQAFCSLSLFPKSQQPIPVSSCRLPDEPDFVVVFSVVKRADMISSPFFLPFWIAPAVD